MTRGRYVGALLRPCWQWVWGRIFTGIAAAGYDDLNPAHIGLFRYPTLDRLRPTEVAKQMQITKQSVNELVGDLEQRGYLTREPDPTDGRARIIRLTTKGRRLERVINAQAPRRSWRSPNISAPDASRNYKQRSQSSRPTPTVRPQQHHPLTDSARLGRPRCSRSGAECLRTLTVRG